MRSRLAARRNRRRRQDAGAQTRRTQPRREENRTRRDETRRIETKRNNLRRRRLVRRLRRRPFRCGAQPARGAFCSPLAALELDFRRRRRAVCFADRILCQWAVRTKSIIVNELCLGCCGCCGCRWRRRRPRGKSRATSPRRRRRRSRRRDNRLFSAKRPAIHCKNGLRRVAKVARRLRAKPARDAPAAARRLASHASRCK